MAAPTVVIQQLAYALAGFSNPSVVGNTYTRAFTSVTVSAGDRIAVDGRTEDGKVKWTSVAQTAGTAVLGSWTQPVNLGVANASGANAVFLNTVTTGGTLTLTGTMTIQTSTGQPHAGATLYIATGATATNTSSSTSARQISYAASASSLIVTCTVDWSAAASSGASFVPTGSTIDIRETDGVSQQASAGSVVSTFCAHWADTGAGGTATYGLSSPSGGTYTTALVEFVGGSGGSGVSVTAVPATATASFPTPTGSTGIGLSGGGAATATASVPAPSLHVGVGLSGVAATATATMPAPSISAGTGVSLTAVPATATASMPAPTVSLASTNDFPSAVLTINTTEFPDTDPGTDGLTLGFDFTVSANTTVTGARVYATRALTGVNVYLWSDASGSFSDGNGIVVASETALSLSTGWNDVPFTAGSQTLVSGTAYAIGWYQPGISGALYYTATSGISSLTSGSISTGTSAGVFGYDPSPVASVPTGASTNWFGIDLVTGASGSVSLTAVPATATATFPTPTIAGGVTLTAAPAAATAAMPTPTGSVGVSVSGGGAMAATASMPAPSLAVGGGISLTAVAAHATASGPLPTLSVGVSLAAAVAQATATMPAPSSSLVPRRNIKILGTTVLVSGWGTNGLASGWTTGTLGLRHPHDVTPLASGWSTTGLTND